METTALKKTNIAERLNLKALPIKDTFSVALITGFIIFILTVGFSMNGNLNRAQAQLENLTERIDQILLQRQN